MIKLSNISKSFEGGEILSSVNLVINNGDKIGLVGQNGSGKTTMIKIMVGELQPDSGSVHSDKSDVIGYLSQAVELSGQETVRDFLMGPYQELVTIKARMDQLAQEMSQSSENTDKLLAEYGELQTEFESKAGYNFEDRFERILEGLNLEVELNSTMSSLSGGQKARVAIARMLLKEPSIFILDEPTNHLDMPALIWLESYLSEPDRTLLVVSHDRRFLDRVVNRIVEINTVSHSLVGFGGNYSIYLVEKARLREKQLRDYEQQQKKFNALKDDIERTKRQARRTEASTKDSAIRRYAKKVAKKAKSREHRLEREITSETVILKPEERQLPRIRLDTDPTNETLFKGTSLQKSYGNRTLFKSLNLTLHGVEKIVIVGENGSGKTTILRLITGEVAPDSGEIDLNPRALVGYLPQEHHELPKTKMALDWFRQQVVMSEDEARAFLGSMAFDQDSLFRPISKLSEGEISRLMIAVLVSGRCNLLILDEPTNHLDFESVELIEKALRNFEGSIVCVTHDRYFIDSVNFNHLLLLEDGALREYRSWQEYEREVSSTSKGGGFK